MRKLSQPLSYPQPENELLSHFMVFDVKNTSEDFGPPTVFFHHSNEENQQEKKDNGQFVGLLVGFIQTSLKFTQTEPCDYILTNLHEIALIELDNDVWISVCRKRSENINPELLKSMLHICRDIYKLFFPLPQRDSTNKVKRASARMLRSAFEMISSAVSWTDINFLNIFQSTFQLTLPTKFVQKLIYIVQTIISSGDFFAHINILYGRYTVFSTLPMDVSTTLAICLKNKLQYLFPNTVESIQDQLFWVIGLSMSSHGFVNVYSPPIIIDGVQYPLVCLKKNKMKIVLLLNPNIQPTPETLQTIPRIIKPITQLFSSFKLETKKGSIQGSYIVIKNNIVNKQIQMANEKLSDPQIPFVENSIVNISYCLHKYDKNTEIFMPVGNDFVSYAALTKKTEDLVLWKSDKSTSIESMDTCKNLIKPGASRRIDVLC